MKKSEEFKIYLEDLLYKYNLTIIKENKSLIQLLPKGYRKNLLKFYSHILLSDFLKLCEEYPRYIICVFLNEKSEMILEIQDLHRDRE
ncbi:hypothetical protein [Tenacibaculum piscium]|uniref:hypothetical protein n=1 Tax=Tenacibaculum piscium TaxID=1458515 RepID=UPI001F1A8C9D|nr:hypothetical protein [Tenacibaculum piscium]